MRNGFHDFFPLNNVKQSRMNGSPNAFAIQNGKPDSEKSTKIVKLREEDEERDKKKKKIEE